MKLSSASLTFLLLMLGILGFGCNRSVTDSSSPRTPNSQTATESALIIQPGNSPAGVDSREPELSSTANGRIILSWVEKIGVSATHCALLHEMLVVGPRRRQ